MTFTLNLSGLVAAVDQINDGATKGVRLGAEHVLTEANMTVPHDEGTLERSGAVDSDDLDAAVSYNTPYAVKQHEDMTLNHHGKGQAKWLENTLTGESQAVGEIIATAIRSEVGL